MQSSNRAPDVDRNVYPCYNTAVFVLSIKFLYITFSIQNTVIRIYILYEILVKKIRKCSVKDFLIMFC